MLEVLNISVTENRTESFSYNVIFMVFLSKCKIPVLRSFKIGICMMFLGVVRLSFVSF